METEQNLVIHDFRQYLQQELVKRCKTNPQYSLRSFARFLDVSPSALSAMINGKRPISDRSKKEFGLKLGLPLEEIKRFSAPASHIDGAFTQVSIDTFAVISEWYHFAILEIMQTESFVSDAGWVARRLGVTKNEINIAVERLARLKFISIDDEGTWRDISGGLTTNIQPGLTSVASKRFQQRLLEKAIQAIDEVPLDERDNTSVTVAIKKRDVAEAKALLKKFRRDMLAFFGRDEETKPDEVYNLCLALYPVTKDTQEN